MATLKFEANSIDALVGRLGRSGKTIGYFPPASGASRVQMNAKAATTKLQGGKFEPRTNSPNSDTCNAESGQHYADDVETFAALGSSSDDAFRRTKIAGRKSDFAGPSKEAYCDGDAAIMV